MTRLLYERCVRTKHIEPPWIIPIGDDLADLGPRASLLLRAQEVLLGASEFARRHARPKVFKQLTRQMIFFNRIEKPMTNNINEEKTTISVLLFVCCYTLDDRRPS